MQAADSLSFLETNIDLMLGFASTGKYSKAEAARKIEEMYERIQIPAAKELARPMWEQIKVRLGIRSLYLRPQSLAELFALLRVHGANVRLRAGGTDLLVRLRKGSEWPAVIVDLKRVAELGADIAELDGRIRIGALAVMTDVIENKRLQKHFKRSAKPRGRGVVNPQPRDDRRQPVQRSTCGRTARRARYCAKQLISGNGKGR